MLCPIYPWNTLTLCNQNVHPAIGYYDVTIERGSHLELPNKVVKLGKLSQILCQKGEFWSFVTFMSTKLRSIQT